jgi:O-antigen ligase
MIFLIIGYVYLMIHRPMEIWPGLEALRPELLYFSLLCAVATMSVQRLALDVCVLAIAFMGGAVYVSWMLSPWAVYGEIVVKNYTLVFVFALILAMTLRDENSVHAVIVAFLAVMTMYMLHSVWEYRNGRHVYRMGISRLIGVDMTLGDPNSFGASIVYSLPFVRYLWIKWGPGPKRKLLIGYSLLAIGCIGLTGSRSSLLGLIACVLMTLMIAGRKRVTVFAGVALLGLVGLAMLPDELKTRFYTIIDPTVGPANAQESGRGRVMGFFIGMDLWSRFPLTGAGPGAWRPASGMKIESHNVYGQIVGELGTLGAAAFLLLLASIGFGIRQLLRMIRRHEIEPRHEPLYHLAQAMAISMLLLLLMGLFGHNLYRYNYVWYAAFLTVLLQSYRRRIANESVEEGGPAWTAAWA